MGERREGEAITVQGYRTQGEGNGDSASKQLQNSCHQLRNVLAAKSLPNGWSLSWTLVK